MSWNVSPACKGTSAHRKHIPPKGAGTLEEAGCVCVGAPTGTVPKTLLKTNIEKVHIKTKRIIYLKGGHKNVETDHYEHTMYHKSYQTLSLRTQ